MTAPFGLHEVLILDEAGGHWPLPTPRAFKFKEVVTTAIVEGEGNLLVETAPESIEFEIEAGGMPLAAYAALTGRTITTSGSTPSEATSLRGRAAERLPNFGLQVRSLDAAGGDVVMSFAAGLCKLVAGLRGEFQDGQFFSGAMKGMAYTEDDTLDLFGLAYRTGTYVHALGVWTVGASDVGGIDAIS